MLSGRSLEEHVRPSIDEERDIRSVGRLSSPPDTIDLIDCLAEFSIRRKTVLQVATYRSRVDCQADGLADHFRRVAIAALQIYRHRQVRRVDDPAQIFDRQG